jgi:hypothetical protein
MLMRNLSGLINLSRYPLADLASSPAQAVIAMGREGLARNGLCLLPDFLTPAALAERTDEAKVLHSDSYYEELAKTDDDSGRQKGFE